MPKRNAARDRVIALRKENLSIFFDISRVLFRDLVDAAASIIIKKKDIIVRFQKKAHNPLLAAAGLDKISTSIPWLGGKNLQFVFG